MANIGNIQDFTIRWNGHQKYKSGKIIENDAVEVIVQKLEMILFTNTGEVYGQDGYDIGVDMEYYLWETMIGNEVLKGKITAQINKYIPEMNIIGYEIELVLFEGEIRDILEINITIKGYNLSFVFA